MAVQEITIIGMRKLPSSNPARLNKFDRVVTYQTETGNILLLTMPDEDFSDTKLKEAIKKDIEEQTAYTGKKITL
jgi:hypothetical protein